MPRIHTKRNRSVSKTVVATYGLSKRREREDKPGVARRATTNHPMQVMPSHTGVAESQHVNRTSSALSGTGGPVRLAILALDEPTEALMPRRLVAAALHRPGAGACDRNLHQLAWLRDRTLMLRPTWTAPPPRMGRAECPAVDHLNLKNGTATRGS